MEERTTARPDPFTNMQGSKARRKQELAVIFTGRVPPPGDQLGRFAGFDGGAREPAPLPRDPEREHGELVSRLAITSRTFRGDTQS